MMDFVIKYFSELAYLFNEMAPWLLFGLVFAGLLKVYFPQKHIDKYLGKPDFKSTVNASLLGVPLPLCSCGVILQLFLFTRMEHPKVLPILS